MLHYRWCGIAKRNTADKMGNETAQRFADALDAEMTKHGFLGYGGVSREAVSLSLRLTVSATTASAST